jgi:transposase
MQCSVCGAEAEDLTSGEFDGLVVRCKRCGEYAVADSALNNFLRLDYDARVAALDKARRSAGSGARPTISTTCL